MTQARKYRTNRLYNLHPHPAQSPHEKPRYISILLGRNADKPRELVRDLYTKSWSAFDRLVSVIPPGGSIG
jgi:xylulokinase